ncbi:MAG: ABC transporter substrate-binding protein [Armatimonadota bacterium]
MALFRVLRYAICTILIVSSLVGCRSGESQSKTPIQVISIWHPFGGVQKEEFDQVVDAFNKSHPGIHVDTLFTPQDDSNNQKFFTAVAAKNVPDVIVVGGHQTPAWAEQGALEPLDDRLIKSGVKPEDYFAPCWRQNTYRGRVWALTYGADPNFALIWNKRIFKEVGLDPNRPPRSIEELDRYNDKITRVVNGKIERMGIIPWSRYGVGNAMLTWGWAFGGNFYNPKTRKITANDPKVIKALEWMVSYAKKYDMTKIGAFGQGQGSREQNPLYLGQVAMQLCYIPDLSDIRMYAPNLDYGLTFLPSPPSGEDHSSWVGGYCLAIPKGCRNPNAAWTFVEWCCHTPQGTSAVGRLMGMFPGYRKSPYFRDIKDDPHYSIFLQILRECRHQRPVIPVQPFYTEALGRALEMALYGRMTPEAALGKATTDVQVELDLAIACK